MRPPWQETPPEVSDREIHGRALRRGVHPDGYEVLLVERGEEVLVQCWRGREVLIQWSFTSLTEAEQLFNKIGS